MAVVDDPEAQAEVDQKRQEVGEGDRPAGWLHREVGEVGEGLADEALAHFWDHVVHEVDEVERPLVQGVLADVDLESVLFGPRDDMSPGDFAGLVGAKGEDELVLVPTLPVALLSKSRLEGRFGSEDQNEHLDLLASSELGIPEP